MGSARYRLFDITDFEEDALRGSMSERASVRHDRGELATTLGGLAEPYWHLRTPEGCQGQLLTNAKLVVTVDPGSIPNS